MPTHEEEDRFLHDLDRLPEAHRERFYAAVKKMVLDLKAGQGFRKGLRVKGVQGHEGVYEMTWDVGGDGRATFSYGSSPITGDVHIIWRRIGGHDIFQNP